MKCSVCPPRHRHYILVGTSILAVFLTSVMFQLKQEARAEWGEVGGYSPSSESQVLNPTATDTDGDGIPNTWEDANLLNKTNPADALSDFDMDGLTALQEYQLRLATSNQYGKHLGAWSATALPRPTGFTAGTTPSVTLIECAGNGIILARVQGKLSGATIPTSYPYTYSTSTGSWTRIAAPDGYPTVTTLTPLDVNSNGQVVGYFNSSGTKGFLWTPDAYGGHTNVFYLNAVNGPVMAIPKRISDTGFITGNEGSLYGRSIAAKADGTEITFPGLWTNPTYHDVNNYGEFIGAVYNPLTARNETFLAAEGWPVFLTGIEANALANLTGLWGEIPDIDPDAITWIDDPSGYGAHRAGTAIDRNTNGIVNVHEGYGASFYWESNYSYYGGYHYWYAYPGFSEVFGAVNDWGEFAGLYTGSMSQSLFDYGEDGSQMYLGGVSDDGILFYEGQYHITKAKTSVYGVSNDAKILLGPPPYSIWSGSLVVPVGNLMSAFANYGTARLADNGKVILQQSWAAQIYVLAPNQDADHDGMPDDWEKYYQLDPNNAADAALDSDGDGISNLAEFQLRTDPKQPPGAAVPSVDLRPGIDTDGDGMPNVWEWKYGLNYNDATDALTDNDADGLTNSQEYFIKTDPGVADMDGDGLPDGEEIALGVNPKDADSDHDSMGDGEDADPKDALVSWKKSPDAFYVLLDVEGSPDSDLPSGWAARDLNDKGEVLFVDGVWTDGGFTAKAFPEMVTRSVPDPEGIEPLNYNVEFQAYEKFNEDGKIIGWAKTTFTTTPAAGGDPLTSSWSWDGTEDPAHLADTVIANQDSVRSFLPMGIDHQGRAFSAESQFGANGEDRRRIVVTAAPGTDEEDPPPGGSAAGEQYIEPSNGYLVAGMDGHFDISRSGCIVTNTESPVDPEHPNAAKTYQLVMWNSSLGEVPLPAGTNGWHFPVHISDTPNNKPALAVTKSGDGGGSVYLQNPSGAMERSTNLSAQQIELFAGDGSAMTRDGRIWRNGKFKPLRDLCPKVGEMLDAGWNLLPFKANKHGTYLIQAEGPNGEVEVKLVVPTDLKAAVGNKEITADKEDTEGAWSVVNFDDDDNDSGAWGHGQTSLKGDLDDANGVTGENDMLRLGMHGVSISGARLRLKFDSSHIRVWKSEFKRPDEAIVSEQTDFDGSGGGWTICHIEGTLPHDDDQGTIVTVQAKTTGENWKDGDSVKIRVAHPVIVVYGDGDLWNGDDKTTLNDFLKDRAGADPTRIRNSLAGEGPTYLVAGKDQNAHNVCYSVTPLSGNATPLAPAPAEKWLKLALQTPNTNICLTGHCNYGVGLALGSNFTQMDQFFNSSGGGYASISRAHFGAEYHDPLAAQSAHNFQWRSGVIADRNAIAAVNPQNRTLQGAGILPNVARYPHVGQPEPATGNIWATQNHPWANMDTNGNITLQGNIKWHYTADPDLDGNGTDDEHSILQTGNADVPANLRYRSLLLNQCNTYRSFMESFRHGVVIASWAPVGSIETTTSYVRGLLEGWSWTKVDEELDKKEHDSGNNGDPDYPEYNAFHVTTF